MKKPTYEEIQQEELTYGQVQLVKYELWSTTIDAQSEEASTQQRVAEGDSWFDHPVRLDILDHLERDYRYYIFKVAEASGQVRVGSLRPTLAQTRCGSLQPRQRAGHLVVGHTSRSNGGDHERRGSQQPNRVSLRGLD
jgi:hypothetical protein